MALSYRAVNRSAVYTRSSGCLTFTPRSTLLPKLSCAVATCGAVSLLLLFYLVAAADIFTRPWGPAHPHLLTPKREPRPYLGQIAVWSLMLILSLDLVGWSGVDMTPVGRSHFLPDSGSAFPCRSYNPDRSSAMDHPQRPPSATLVIFVLR